MIAKLVVVLGACWVASGCIEPDLVSCDDGTLCPTNTVCAPSGGGCAPPDSIAACAGKSAGDSCDAPAAMMGHCFNGWCQVTACGDGVVDPGEQCDDGNGVNDDGCTNACTLPTCGDGIVQAGETCDDRNQNPADGCDQCRLETWIATAVLGGNATPATQVGLEYPSMLAVDRAGNLFIADPDEYKILRLDAASHTLTVIAGTGVYGFSGDGGLATNAELNGPDGVAIDGLGNLVFADGGSRVRRIDASSGVITTIAGTGAGGFSGDGGLATAATFGYIRSVALDGLGNVYIADDGTSRVRMVAAQTGIVTTVAGNGTGAYNGDGGLATAAELVPYGLAVDASGDIYVSDWNGAVVRRIDGTTGIITTVAGTYYARGYSGDGGPATAALLSSPWQLALDQAGDLYIDDTHAEVIRRIDATTGTITTVAGNGTAGFAGDGGAATSAELGSPNGVAIDAGGALFISDSNANRIRQVAADGTIATVAGNGLIGALSVDGIAGTNASVGAGVGIAFGPTGQLVFVDANRVRALAANGTFMTLAGTGTQGYTGDGGPATAAELLQPTGVSVASNGDVYFVDDEQYVRRIDASSGVITTIAGSATRGYSGDGGPATSAELQYPQGLTLDAAGDIFIADWQNHCVRRIDATTGVITTVAGVGTGGFSGDNGPATDAELYLPFDVALDSAGDLFIADSQNKRIRRVDATTGVITTVAGGGAASPGDGGLATDAALETIYGLSIDSAGDLFLTEPFGGVIRRVDGTTGIITTIAGSATSGFAGDGGLATSAELGFPVKAQPDAAGNLYITENFHIRRVDAVTGIITTVAGQVDPAGTGSFTVAELADVQAITVANDRVFFAGGASGTVEMTQATTPPTLEVAAGRYPQPGAIGGLARYGGSSFGSVGGVAYDAAGARVFVSEQSANRIDVVSLVDPAKPATWTISVFAGTGSAGFADGAATTARFRAPAGLYYDATASVLYVADSGNHVVRAIGASTGVVAGQVSTVAGTPATLGYFGDGGAPTDALLDTPRGLVMCGNGDVFIADTGNNRIRRLHAGAITTVLGDGTISSAGGGAPATDFPVDAPTALTCDAFGNVYVTSTTAIRQLLAADDHSVDGTGSVTTIYGAPPRTSFPASATSCIRGIAVVDAQTLELVDECSGLLVQLAREAQ